MFRVPEPVRNDTEFEEGVLDAPVATRAAVEAADVLILGAPSRQGGPCGEMRLFLDSLAPLQAAEGGPTLRGRVGAAFTSVGGPRGPGGAETVLAALHAWCLHHAMVVVGNPPSPAMAGAAGATPLGAVVVADGGGAGLEPAEVRLGYALGQWAAQVGSLLHDAAEHGAVLVPTSPGRVGA